MTKAKHTPGPWSSIGYDSVTDEIIICRSDGHYVASIDCDGCYDDLSGPEIKSNAHLIAAAPDLLEALEAAVDCGLVPKSSASDGGASKYSRQVHVADMIRAAIAKAKGETQ